MPGEAPEETPTDDAYGNEYWSLAYLAYLRALITQETTRE